MNINLAGGVARAVGPVCLAACALPLAPRASGAAASASTDSRIRTWVYAVDEVYRLEGYVGYQIDLEFEAGESFVGLGAGDLESLTFAAQGNHLFLKPRAAGVATNLTVVTSRRTYHFEYFASVRRPDPAHGDVIYALRFAYPAPPAPAPGTESVERHLAHAQEVRRQNRNYDYRGSAGLKPESVWDDGVQTWLRFGAHQELPAVFVRNDDGSESLVNFSVESGEVVVHRIARQFMVRRGRLAGCIVNHAFTGSGVGLESGTIAPAVRRVTKSVPP